MHQTQQKDIPGNIVVNVTKNKGIRSHTITSAGWRSRRTIN